MPMNEAQRPRSGFAKKSPLVVVAILIVFIFGYHALSRVAAAASVQNPRLASLPPNTALSLGAYSPAPLAGCNQRSETITAYSRLTYDSANHQMLMFGGGHASTPRTDVDVFNPGTLSWNSAYPSTPVSEMTGANFNRTTGGWNTTGHPMARHTYDMMPFAPNVGELIMLKGTDPGPNCQERGHLWQQYEGKIWHYNPVSKQWRPSAVNAFKESLGMFSAGAEYDPVSGKILIVGRGGILTYDPRTEVMERVTFQRPDMYMSQNMVYFPPNDKFYYIHNNGEVFEVTYNRANLAASTVVQIAGITGSPPPLTMPNIPGAQGETGWAYDSANKIIGGGIVNGLFHAYDPIAKTWTATRMQVSPSTATVGKLAFHAIDYDPVNNVFVFIDRVPVGGGVSTYTTWAYKYGGGSTTPAPTPTPSTQGPSVPTGLSAVAVSATQINLSWNASAGIIPATGYRIYRNGSLLATLPGTSYSSTNLSPGTTYSYAVAAYSSTGNASAQSSSAVATTLASVPPPTPPSGSPVSNGITITEQDGITTDNYPVQIGRPFIQGEIFGYPIALVNGTAVATQADVKQRWSDGSVKHSVVTFLIPRLAARQTISVTFGSQTTGNNTPLSKDQMLAANFDFEALMGMSGGVTGTASARRMLTDGSFSYWLRGPVATSIILADHSAKRIYDMGSDAHRAFRPIFHATFWPGINKVHVRFIGEIANSEAFQNQTYALALKVGLGTPAAPPATIYGKPAVTHYAGSRWTKEFWIGGKPSSVAINHNLAYLVKTKMLPNYDTSRAVPESQLALEYSKWQAAPKDLYDTGNWTKMMSGVGGRPDIGIYPTWTVQWLYSGDIRLKEKAFGNADLAAAWPFHFREGDPAKFLDRTRTVPGLGRILSISTRPTIDITSLNRLNTKPEDKIDVPLLSGQTLKDVVTDGGWRPDSAHAPDMFSPQYLLSGDYWYLEEMLFWTAWGAMNSSGTAIKSFNGRGPTGAEGGTAGKQTRYEAWTMRNRVEAVNICPDDWPEKSYFKTLIEDQIAIAEGQRGITGTAFYNNANWQWGNTYSRIGTYVFGRSDFKTDIGFPPLRQWMIADNLHVAPTDPTDLSVSKYGVTPFEQNFLLYALGRAKELGHPSGVLLSWLGQNLIGQLTSPDFNPYLSGLYKMPVTRQSDGKYFQTWAELKTGYSATGLANAQTVFNSQARIQNLQDHGYPFIAMAAAAMIADEPGGAAAWKWIYQAVAENNPKIDANPKWALLPRSVP